MDDEARELTWEALRGRLKLSLAGFDWQDSSAPPELKEALADLPKGIVRKADLEVTLSRLSDEAVEAEGSLKVEQLNLEGKEAPSLQLADASLSGAGRYEVASGAVDLEGLRFASPWLESEFTGRLEPLSEGLAVEGTSRGQLNLEGLPRAGREALAGQGVAVEGPITWEANINASPQRTVVSGFLGLQEAGLRLAGLGLRSPGEPGRVSFDLERVGEPWTIHRLELQAPEGTLQVVGKVNWKPPQRTTVDLRVTSRLLTERLAEHWYKLFPDSRLHFAALGAVKAQATVRGLLEGLTLTGSLDATDALLAVGPLALKSPGEQASVKASLELKKNTLLVRKAQVSLPLGNASLRGKLPMDSARPRYDLRASLNMNLDELQRRLDDEVLLLPAGVTVSGYAEAEAAVNRFQRALNLEAQVDATALEVHWGLEGEKPSGVPARLKLRSNFERGAEVEELALQLGPAAATLAGQVAEDWKSASLSYQGSVMELSSLAPLWQPLAEKEVRGGVSARGTLEWSEGQTAANGSVDFLRVALTLPEEPAVRIGLHGRATHSPTSFSTEGLILTVDDQPITITAGVEKSDSKLEVLSLMEAGKLNLTNLLAHLKGPEGSKPSPWAPMVASAIRDGLRLHGRIRADELKLDSYPLAELDLEMKASDGVLRVPIFDFGLNGGEASHDLTVDFTGQEPLVKASLGWKGLGANPNLRPFLDKVFPNLFVTGSMDFSARYQASGGDADRLAETLEGTSTMDVYGGYLVSAPTPEETRNVFPTLTMSHYAFERAHIETQVSQGRSHNVMKFQAPTVDLGITGWTDNKTREIDYVMTVDLVENLGLGGARDNIPGVLQSASRVEIAYVKGTLDDQRVEHLRPKVLKIKETLKSLLGLKALQNFLVEMSEEEKSNYLKGKVGGLLGAAATPFRYLKRKLNTQ